MIALAEAAGASVEAGHYEDEVRGGVMINLLAVHHFDRLVILGRSH